MPPAHALPRPGCPPWHVLAALSDLLPWRRRPAAQAAPQPAAPAPALRPAVLVVDDVAANRRLVGALLQRAGFAHDEAEDAATALRLAATRPYAAVLMDLEMPEVDGLEATRRLRALPGLAASLPVIALTAHDSEAMRAATREAGMDGFLVKPVQAAGLAELIGRAAAARAALARR